MSFLGRGPSAGSPSGVNQDRVEQATQELELITDIFNRLVTSCHTKCVSTRYTEGDLNKGESVCIDRCVAKFFAVNKKVGEKMQTLGAAAGGGAPGAFSM
ncbi:Tim10/DDP family zinc finger-domain-containing protein [Epithele typhae]|uniref:Tim10/DDP family zinc finger-domain-containing protein n=1 Tax=Epithele typhae TaxID=378194 RepID=UPI0020073E5F|nr:Tim10/DDP family zinc finger-domain-containing protein [Epithele typhae]KAH9921963.1 Tim10/DDP family zinc finger-domain-containing protein [Epithele typhae]